MGNIIRLAPYAYLAKRSGNNTLYDLLLLVPVDNSGDTNLSNVTPVKAGGTRITIDYATTTTAANAPYRFKHWEIDSDGTYVEIEIQGDNNADRTIILALADADTEQASVTNNYQTCAPYLFAKKETISSSLKYAHPSCIILFDAGLGALTESVVINGDDCTVTFTLGNAGVVTDPVRFAVNSVKAEMVMNGVHIFDASVAAYTPGAGNKPPRKNIRKVLW